MDIGTHIEDDIENLIGSQRPILDLMASQTCASINLFDFISLGAYVTLFRGPYGHSSVYLSSWNIVAIYKTLLPNIHRHQVDATFRVNSPHLMATWP